MKTTPKHHANQEQFQGGVGDPERKLDFGIHGVSSLPQLLTGVLNPLSRMFTLSALAEGSMDESNQR